MIQSNNFGSSSLYTQLLDSKVHRICLGWCTIHIHTHMPELNMCCQKTLNNSEIGKGIEFRNTTGNHVYHIHNWENVRVYAKLMLTSTNSVHKPLYSHKSSSVYSYSVKHQTSIVSTSKAIADLHSYYKYNVPIQQKNTRLKLFKTSQTQKISRLPLLLLLRLTLCCSLCLSSFSSFHFYFCASQTLTWSVCFLSVC